MYFQMKPWNGNERLYFYRQSLQLAGQTGQIGKLRADFDRDGNGFFSSWEDIREHLKTDEFKETFDKAINALRFGEGETPFASRKALTEFLRDKHSAILPGDGEWHGFRADIDNTSLFFRVKPSPGDYDIYCWAYRKDWLDDHMARAERGIRFIDSGYNEKFRIPDGGKIRIKFADGTIDEKTCRYIDDTHVEFDGGGGAYGLQHICEFAERLENVGATVEPVDEPMVMLHEKYYCPLKLAVFERDEYGDLEEDGYDLDGRYAARYEDEIKELLKKEHSYDGCDPKADIPLDLYLCHVRGDDETTGGFAELAPRVLVNHFGSIITKEPVNFGKEGYIPFTEETEPNFTGQSISMRDFINGRFSMEPVQRQSEGMTLS